jgi:hypothetical protein
MGQIMKAQVSNAVIITCKSLNRTCWWSSPSHSPGSLCPNDQRTPHSPYPLQRPPYTRSTGPTRFHTRSTVFLASKTPDFKGPKSWQGTETKVYESMWRASSLSRDSGASSAAGETSRSPMVQPVEPGTFEDVLDKAMKEDITPLSEEEYDWYRNTNSVPETQPRGKWAQRSPGTEVSGFPVLRGRTAGNLSGHPTSFSASVAPRLDWLEKAWKKDVVSLGSSSDAKSSSSL